MKRRIFLKGVMAAAGLGFFKTNTALPVGKLFRPQIKKGRSIRFAHITDVHVRPEHSGDKGFAYALGHIQNHKDSPSFILNTGDAVMDVLYHPKEQADIEWGLWKKVTEAECSIPIISCIGNHDVFGWNKKAAKTTGTEPLYGKKMPTHYYNLKNRYYSFDKAGWHFIALDGIAPSGLGFDSRLDDEQFQWLKEDLAETTPETPVLIFSHPPILSVGGQLFTGDARKWTFWSLNDAPRIIKLFRHYSNVKLCLAGHNHIHDRVLYEGITYISGGAVSGGKWSRMNMNGFPAGYGMVDLYKDGSFEYQYVTHGWKAKPK
ncbi:MAG: metallophosphoesterase family protein [Planctomycetota bacterium]|jgi:3',5'-cyclic AMP phosphodiesterase CpdA